MKIPGMLISILVSMNCHPIADPSNRSIGILVVDHAPMKSNMFENLLPLFNRAPATGKAAYKGPAEKEPSMRASDIPSSPDFSPIRS